MRRIPLAFVGVVSWLAVGAAQDQQFEVASIRPTVGTMRQTRFQIQPNGRFVARWFSASLLIQQAYGRRALYIDGLPDWANNDFFDVQAKASDRDSPVGAGEVVGMLRSLLGERFGLKLHRETRVKPAYLLVRDRQDRPLPSGIRLSTAKCAGRRPENVGVSPGCGIHSRAVPDGVLLTFEGRTLAEFASDLERMVQRPVVDQTGIEGQYDIDLDVARTSPADNALGAMATTFTAVRFLGLRLDAADAAVEVLVIDAIHRPTPN